MMRRSLFSKFQVKIFAQSRNHSTWNVDVSTIQRAREIINDTTWKNHKKLVKDLCSDQAGEYGAVRIYDGASFAASKCKSLLRILHPKLSIEKIDSIQKYISFHKETEKKHLQIINKIVDPQYRTKLIPLWNIMGFSLGFLPLLFSSEKGLYKTIEYVETFVEQHYLHQINWIEKSIAEEHDLQMKQRMRDLLEILQNCCADEVHHKDDSLQRANEIQFKENMLWKLWKKIVASGSSIAVYCSKIL